MSVTRLSSMVGETGLERATPLPLVPGKRVTRDQQATVSFLLCHWRGTGMRGLHDTMCGVRMGGGFLAPGNSNPKARQALSVELDVQMQSIE